jgi:hypothetical protein
MSDQPSLLCPNAAGKEAGAAPGDARDAHSVTAAPKLVRFSDVQARQSRTSSLTCIAAWVRNYLAQPHPDLGRPGLVCPFIPLALRMDSIWMAEVADAAPSFESIAAAVMYFRDVFLTLEPLDGHTALQKAIIIVFPALAGGTAGSRLVDAVQFALKKQFVPHGLMLGEFHSANESPGLHNGQFRPLRSPIPLLAIRHMVEADLPFLVNESYSPEERASFLRSYLLRLSGRLKPAKFEQALERLISVEVALRAGAPRAGPSPHGNGDAAPGADATQAAAAQS